MIAPPVKRLGELVDILSGYAFDSAQFADEGDMPIVRIRDVGTDGDRTFYRGSYDPRYVLTDGDLLIAMDGEFRRARWRGGPALLNQRVCRIAASCPQLDDRYLFHFLPAALQSIEDLTPFATVKHLSTKVIRDIRIPVPPLEEQRRVADILDRVEALRLKRRHVLETIADLETSTFAQWFTSTKLYATRPLGAAFAEPPNYGSMIPPSESGSWLALRVANIQDSRLDFRDRKYVDLPTDASRERHSVRDGDLLMARAIASQAHLGKCVVVHPGSALWAFDSHLMRIRLDDALLAPEFLQQWLRSAQGRAAFLGVARKSVVQFNVNTKEMAALRVPMAPIAEQRRFVQFLRLTTAYRNTATCALDQLDALFASLRARAFRGEL